MRKLSGLCETLAGWDLIEKDLQPRDWLLDPYMAACSGHRHTCISRCHSCIAGAYGDHHVPLVILGPWGEAGSAKCQCHFFFLHFIFWEVLCVIIESECKGLIEKWKTDRPSPLIWSWSSSPLNSKGRIAKSTPTGILACLRCTAPTWWALLSEGWRTARGVERAEKLDFHTLLSNVLYSQLLHPSIVKWLEQVWLFWWLWKVKSGILSGLEVFQHVWTIFKPTVEYEECIRMDRNE